MVQHVDTATLRPAADHLRFPPRVYVLPDGLATSPDNGLDAIIARSRQLGFDWLAARPSAGRWESLASGARRAGLNLLARVSDAEISASDDWRAIEADGYLFTSAGRVPATEWRTLLAELRRKRQLWIVAETLAGPLSDPDLQAAGFDWFLNSLAWWDLRDPWFIDQQRELPRHVRTLSTVDQWPTPGLVEHLDAQNQDAIARTLKARYALATIAGSGLICPMGFEIGSAGASDIAEDWATYERRKPFDISADIRALNGLMMDEMAGARDSRMILASAPDATVLALAKPVGKLRDAGRIAMLLINAQDAVAQPPPLGELAVATGGATAFVDVLANDASALRSLAPLEARILTAEIQGGVALATLPAESEDRLETLAASRLIIESVSPEIDTGRFSAKGVVGEAFRVEADVFMDGHEKIAACIRYRPTDEPEWREAPLTFFNNDRWSGSFVLGKPGRYVYTIEAWRDLFGTWQDGVAKKIAAGQKTPVELIEAGKLIARAKKVAPAPVRDALSRLESVIAGAKDEREAAELLLAPESTALFAGAGLRDSLTRYERELAIMVCAPITVFAAWYEVLPRSMSGDPKRHGTFDDVIARLPYIRDLGFDVLYFPPIHPIGRTNRKGKDNSLTAKEGDPGSPYAIGSDEGGHDALHPELGDFASLKRLVDAAREQGIWIAIDFAVQCSPDHPWIKQHPEWFEWRPDGTIRYAENPPKKYEDIVVPNFYGDSYPSLWLALRDVVMFWIDKGVTIFRVDNPHTKPVPFWEWMIRDVKNKHPEAMFLAEAFTRPKMMRRLAKAGFDQSYSYFTWRNTKAELTEYLTELTESDSRHFMLPNFFVNTPDINPRFLQTSGRSGFQSRLILAATLSPVFGLYNGYELCEARAIPGKEEYAESEKYELKAWDWDRPGNIKDDVRLINRIRRENPALWRFKNLTFLNAFNDQVIAYYKTSLAKDNLVVFVVNLDPHDGQGAHYEIPLWEFGLPDHASVEAVNLLTNRRQTLTGKTQHYYFNPAERPYAAWRLIPPDATRAASRPH